MFANLTEEKKKFYYNILRGVNLVLTALSVPLSLIYLKHFNTDVDGASGFNFIAVLYCLGVMMYCEQYFFPLDLKGAVQVTGYLFINIFAGIIVSTTSVLYISYQIVFITLCLQAIFSVGFSLSLLLDYFYALPFYNQTEKSFSMSFWSSAFMFLILSPLIIAPYTMGAPVFYELSHLDDYGKWTMICAIGWNVGWNVIRVGRILFTSHREEHKVKAKKLGDWEGAINMIFFLILLSIFGISFI
jgi:hypothetical protein